MVITFEKLSEKHRKPVMDIYNYYVRTSTAAFPNEPVSYDSYERFLHIADTYPAYVVVNEDHSVMGFCLISDYIAHNTFRATAAVTYFIDSEFTGKGIGSKCLEKLEEDAFHMEIHNLVAEISSENNSSICFHKKHGFSVIGELKGIGYKFGRDFGLVLMQKKI